MLNDCLLTQDLDNIEIHEEDNDPFEKYLSKAAQAIRGGWHATHDKSPSQLVFGRDMFMPKDTEIDWDVIKARKQERIAKSNDRENSKIVKHHDNGMITYQKEPFNIEKVNSRRNNPFHWRHGPPTRSEDND